MRSRESLPKGPTWTEAAIGELVRKKKKYYVDRQPITFFPGVELLISELKDRKVPMAIVTAGHLWTSCDYPFRNVFWSNLTP